MFYKVTDKICEVPLKELDQNAIGIGILSMELYRGVPVSIIADGPDAAAAADAVRHLLEGDR